MPNQVNRTAPAPRMISELVLFCMCWWLTFSRADAARIYAYDEETHREQIQYALEQTAWIKEILSVTQFRRLWMRYVDGLKLREIAKIEGVSRPCISDSILSAKSKILHYREKNR